MLYAKVVVGLAVAGPFDYIVPQAFEKKISVGCRVVISFGNKNLTGYVIGLSSKTNIKKLKSLTRLIDEIPVLNECMLSLTKEMSEYYCCSWGEAIETALPLALRKGQVIELKPAESALVEKAALPEQILIHSQEKQDLWDDVYIPKIKKTLSGNRSALVLLSDIPEISKAEKIIRTNFNCPVAVLYRKQAEELKNWVDIKEGRIKLVLGTRSSVFAPLTDLGLIIIDDEQAYAYKQDQVPHYHAREIGLMRCRIEKADIILASNHPSLEAIYLAKNNKLKFTSIPRSGVSPEIKIVDMKGLPLVSFKNNLILSKYLENSISEALAKKGKVLLFLNRFGFATTLLCANCGQILKCARCNAHLVFHYKENILSCHYCNFKMAPPKICPGCNAGYIRYKGAGTEKMVSEISRIFPQAKVKQISPEDTITIDSADIFISGQSVIKETTLNFDLVGILSIDSCLQQIDFRSTEKTFDILSGLSMLTDNSMIIQTSLPEHYVFKAILEENNEVFYNEELKQRKELKFPPYTHISIVKLRGAVEEKVMAAAKLLFEKLSAQTDPKIEVMSVNPANPSKLRGNFYWQILLRGKSCAHICEFLKINLNSFKHSGIIVTVDVDPT